MVDIVNTIIHLMRITQKNIGVVKIVKYLTLIL